MQISLEKPGFPSDVLEHFGKKGMKWGVRNAPATSAGRSRAIYRARARSESKRITAVTAPRGSAERKKARLVYLNDPDRATSLRMSRGEKVVLGILGLAVPPVGVGIAVGAGARVAARRRIEKKQASGGYK